MVLTGRVRKRLEKQDGSSAAGGPRPQRLDRIESSLEQVVEGGSAPGRNQRENRGLMNTIVVGVDGSTQGEAALRFAAEEAALREFDCSSSVPGRFP